MACPGSQSQSLIQSGLKSRFGPRAGLINLGLFTALPPHMDASETFQKFTCLAGSVITL